MDSHTTLSVIIPAWNEEERIEKTLRKYINFLNKNFNNFEIIVITDGCKDNTPLIVKRLSKEFKCIRHVHPPKRLGKGGAIIKGFKLANGEIIGFLDADGSISSQSVKSLIDTLKDSNFDGVIASRWKKEARILKKQSIQRRIASRVFNFLVKGFFHLTFEDTQCGAKFFKSKAIKSVLPELGLTDWAFDVDLLYRLKKKGFKIKEIPVTWKHEEGSKLKLSKTSVKMFLSIMGLRVKTSRLAFLAKFPLIEYVYRKVEEW